MLGAYVLNVSGPLAKCWGPPLNFGGPPAKCQRQVLNVKGLLATCSKVQVNFMEVLQNHRQSAKKVVWNEHTNLVKSIYQLSFYLHEIHRCITLYIPNM